MTPHHRFRTPLTVWRPEVTVDGGGGRSVSFVEVGEVLAQVSQPTATERRIAEQAGADLTHVVHMAPEEDVRRNDELRRGDETLVVTAVFQPSQPRYLRADCVLRQAGG